MTWTPFASSGRMMPGGYEVSSAKGLLLRVYALEFAFNSRVVVNPKEIEMSKGQQKGNRESKKPKKEKIKVIAAAPSQKAAGWQPSFGSGKKK
jgi:hypothetical protein